MGPGCKTSWAHRLRDRRVGVEPMTLKDVDVVELKPLEGPEGEGKMEALSAEKRRATPSEKTHLSTEERMC